ncbi:unnamed protein product, partial [Discosporangium mesarthrocarpum]
PLPLQASSKSDLKDASFIIAEMDKWSDLVTPEAYVRRNVEYKISTGTTLPEVLFDFWKAITECIDLHRKTGETSSLRKLVMFVAPYAEDLQDYHIMEQVNVLLGRCTRNGGCVDLGKAITLLHYHPNFLNTAKPDTPRRALRHAPYPSFSLDVFYRAGGLRDFATVRSLADGQYPATTPPGPRADTPMEGRSQEARRKNEEWAARARQSLEGVYTKAASYGMEDEVGGIKTQYANQVQRGGVPESSQEILENTQAWLKRVLKEAEEQDQADSKQANPNPQQQAEDPSLAEGSVADPQDQGAGAEVPRVAGEGASVAGGSNSVKSKAGAGEAGAVEDLAKGKRLVQRMGSVSHVAVLCSSKKPVLFHFFFLPVMSHFPSSLLSFLSFLPPFLFCFDQITFILVWVRVRVRVAALWSCTAEVCQRSGTVNLNPNIHFTWYKAYLRTYVKISRTRGECSGLAGSRRRQSKKSDGVLCNSMAKYVNPPPPLPPTPTPFPTPPPPPTCTPTPLSTQISQFVVARSKTAEEAYGDVWEAVTEITKKALDAGCDVATEDYSESVTPCYSSVIVIPDFATFSADTFSRFQETLNRALTELPMTHKVRAEVFHPEAVSKTSMLDHPYLRSPYPTIHMSYLGVQ